MNTNTVYDSLLPETERQRHIELVNEYNEENGLQKTSHLTQDKEKKRLVYTKQNAMDYLMKNVFTSKNKLLGK
jgi:hypothetical protein